MIQRLRQHARRHVGDARDAEDLESHVTRDNRLGHRRHADRIGADRAKVPDLRRRLITRPQQPDVHAMRKAQPEVRRRLARQLPQASRVQIRQVRKARAEAIVIRSDERIVAHEVDVVVDDHERALHEPRVDAARGVGEDERLHTEQPERAHGKGDRPRIVSLVQVTPSRERRNRSSAHGADDQASLVSDHRGRRPVRQPAVRH